MYHCVSLELKEANIIIPFYSWGNSGSEMLSDLPEFLVEGSSKTGTITPDSMQSTRPQPSCGFSGIA